MIGKQTYKKRADLIEKCSKIQKYKATDEEIKEAYGYLDYCLICGKKFSFLDFIFFNISHSFFGNTHRWFNCGEKSK